MAIGQRIKFFRNLRKFTQKELGLKLNFPENAADVRVAQYESETRIPKEDVIKAFADNLDVSPSALDVPNIDSYIGLMHTLFALEDMYGLKVNNIDGQVCITLDTENQSYLEMFKMISAWQKEYQRFIDGEITKEEYDQWRYTYPEAEANRFKQAINKLRDKNQ